MKNQKSTNPNRRQFITKIVPACAMTCLGAKQLLGMQQKQTDEEVKHKFDQPMERQMTYRQYFKRAARGEIDLLIPNPGAFPRSRGRGICWHGFRGGPRGYHNRLRGHRHRFSPLRNRIGITGSLNRRIRKQGIETGQPFCRVFDT